MKRYTTHRKPRFARLGLATRAGCLGEAKRGTGAGASLPGVVAVAEDDHALAAEVARRRLGRPPAGDSRYCRQNPRYCQKPLKQAEPNIFVTAVGVVAIGLPSRASAVRPTLPELAVVLAQAASSR